jgi:tight adherence protein B
MPSLETIAFQMGRYGPMVAVAAAAFLLFEALFLMWSQSRRREGRINERLRVKSDTADGRAALVALRRRRGLTADGRYELPLIAFNRLVMQSGLTLPVWRLVLLMSAVAGVVAVLTYMVTRAIPLAVLAAAFAGVGLPLMVLLVMRSKRLKALEAQLPEAVDVMVRSLRAGHPLPVAIAMVAREMPDPVGSEFGMVADEMTYGLDIETAMSNMRTRAGQSDLSFLVVAISIQSKTGGNLAEILVNLSRMVRERARMRRKIHSLSSEGRFSAIGLSVIPSVLAAIIHFLAPTYFSEVEHDPLFMPAVYTGLVMWAIGVYTLRRMVNFKF